MIMFVVSKGPPKRNHLTPERMFVRTRNNYVNKLPFPPAERARIA